MINYYKDIFTKPTILWSALEKLAVVGIVAACLVIIFIIGCVVLWIIETIKTHRFTHCCNIKCPYAVKGNEHCLHCKQYKKRQKPKIVK